MKQIENYPDYFITENGEVWSSKNNIWLVKKTEKLGYITVCLSNDNGRKYLKVHRLVALTFIPNPERKPQVNHKDGIKSNNHVSNLEWATASENNLHACRTGLRTNTQNNRDKAAERLRAMSGDKSPSSKRVKDTATGQEYVNIREAARAIGMTHDHLGRILSGKKPNFTTLVYA